MSRQDWAAYDLLSLSGKKIEAKSSAYLQSWNQERLFNIQFSIRPARSWSVENGFSSDLERWEFYVLPTFVLDRCCKAQKIITLNSLLSLLPIKTTYKDLQDTVENFR